MLIVYLAHECNKRMIREIEEYKNCLKAETYQK